MSARYDSPEGMSGIGGTKAKNHERAIASALVRQDETGDSAIDARGSPRPRHR